jgi:hypothetical protein
MIRQSVVYCLTLAVILPATTLAQDAPQSVSGVGDASAEMRRLAQALGGDWNNVETMERSESFPKGGGRTGTSHCGLTTDGVALLCEGNSDGSAGKLSHLIVIWWDKNAKLYGFFICFRDWGSGCEIRGTAHWEGDVFVNDYAENIKGRSTKMRDSFIDITPNSHTLVAAIETPDGKMRTLITTRSTRR